MTIDELSKKVERIRMVTDAKLKYIRDHTRLLDQAFEELKDMQNDELDLVYDKIKELDSRMDRNGLVD